MRRTMMDGRDEILVITPVSVFREEMQPSCMCVSSSRFAGLQVWGQPLGRGDVMITPERLKEAWKHELNLRRYSRG